MIWLQVTFSKEDQGSERGEKDKDKKSESETEKGNRGRQNTDRGRFEPVSFHSL